MKEPIKLAILPTLFLSTSAALAYPTANESMKLFLCLAFASFLTSGCASNIERMYTPAGQRGYNISCDNGYFGGAWKDCYRDASNLCGSQGYKVFGRQFEPSGFYSPARRTLLIGCGQQQ